MYNSTSSGAVVSGMSGGQTLGDLLGAFKFRCTQLVRASLSCNHSKPHSSTARFDTALCLGAQDDLSHLQFTAIALSTCAAVTLFNHGQVDQAAQHFAEFRKLFDELDEETRNADPDILEQQALLAQALGA